MKNNRKSVIIGTGLLCAAMLFTSCGSGDEVTSELDERIVNPNASVTDVSDTNAASAESTQPSLPSSVSPDEAPEAAEVPDDYMDRITFLGDSTTYGLRHYGVLKGGKDTTQVWTPKSGTLALFNISTATIVYPESKTDEEIPIIEAVKRKKPEYLVITIGVNGISMMNETQFKTSYKWLITEIVKASPNTKIIAHSMYPVASNYEYLSSINNDKITNGNKWIQDIANECGVMYLDTYSVLVGEDGWLPQKYQNGDGLHLNPEGFDIVLENIRNNPYNK